MTNAAVKQIGKAWVALPADTELLAGLGKRTIFDLGLPDVAPMTSTLPTEAREILRRPEMERPLA